MKILATVKRIPGGLMVVPLILGALVNTFCGGIWEKFDGTFTTYLWKSGAMPLLSAFIFCNATTIDISYVRFGEDSSNPRNLYELRLALAQTLHELRKEGRCYVKIERKQYCYHITVR